MLLIASRFAFLLVVLAALCSCLPTHENEQGHEQGHQPGHEHEAPKGGKPGMQRRPAVKRPRPVEFHRHTIRGCKPADVRLIETWLEEVWAAADSSKKAVESSGAASQSIEFRTYFWASQFSKAKIAYELMHQHDSAPHDDLPFDIQCDYKAKDCLAKGQPEAGASPLAKAVLTLCEPIFAPAMLEHRLPISREGEETRAFCADKAKQTEVLHGNTPVGAIIEAMTQLNRFGVRLGLPDWYPHGRGAVHEGRRIRSQGARLFAESPAQCMRLKKDANHDKVLENSMSWVLATMAMHVKEICPKEEAK